MSTAQQHVLKATWERKTTQQYATGRVIQALASKPPTHSWLKLRLRARCPLGETPASSSRSRTRPFKSRTARGASSWDSPSRGERHPLVEHVLGDSALRNIGRDMRTAMFFGNIPASGKCNEVPGTSSELPIQSTSGKPDPWPKESTCGIAGPPKLYPPGCHLPDVQHSNLAKPSVAKYTSELDAQHR